jgi:hypothetical protein
MVRLEAVSREVSGTAAAAAAAVAAVTPGTISNGICRRLTGSSSSRRRAKTAGSPPLSLTTIRPGAARSASQWPICRPGAIAAEQPGDRQAGGGGQLQHGRRHQLIVHHDIGGLQSGDGPHRQQVGFSRPAADEDHPPWGRAAAGRQRHGQRGDSGLVGEGIVHTGIFRAAARRGNSPGRTPFSPPGSPPQGPTLNGDAVPVSRAPGGEADDFHSLLAWRATSRNSLFYLVRSAGDAWQTNQQHSSLPSAVTHRSVCR